MSRSDAGREACEAPPWRAEWGPQPPRRTYATGREPMLRIRTAGRWRPCVVVAREDRPDGTVYAVEVPFGPNVFYRYYRWDPDAMRVLAYPGAGVQPKRTARSRAARGRPGAGR